MFFTMSNIYYLGNEMDNIISNHDSYFITIVENVFCTKSSMKQVNKLSREPFRSPLSPLMNGNMIYLLINFCIIFNFIISHPTIKQTQLLLVYVSTTKI